MSRACPARTSASSSELDGVTVGIGAEGQSRAGGGERDLRIDKPGGGESGELRRCRGNAKQFGDRSRDGGGIAGRSHVRDPADRDGPPEQSPRRRDGQEHADHAAARRLSGDGDPCRVAAEVRDIVADPFEGGDAVPHAAVRGGAVDGEEALDAETVVDVDDDNAVAVVAAAVKPWAGVAAGGVAAAVDEDQHGQARSAEVGREEVEVEVVVAGYVGVGDDGRLAAFHLRRRRALLEGVTDAVPGCRCGGGLETQGANGWCCVGNAAKRDGLSFAAAADATGRGIGDQVHDSSGRRRAARPL